MYDLTITVSSENEILISVNGVIIGLVEELSLYHHQGTAPTVKIKLLDLSTYTETALRERLLAHLHKYREMLQQLPYVELFDQADTLPTGMSAVKPEES